jgi:hypothetical protein
MTESGVNDSSFLPASETVKNHTQTFHSVRPLGQSDVSTKLKILRGSSIACCRSNPTL